MTPDSFDPTSGRILNLRPDASGRQMIFETDGVVVTSFYSGFETAVIRIEGCA